ncbi:7144_t:CDS:2 [Entrophospora sp. SA101]|nr:14747_t:CDS:2 [Entrophospora sp. SA101]CAJ0758522.1 7144_t:CDS:2 [Entrophospora sp. SA101]CAJ0841372.1 7630_t:CDS:2 [Entrophospora sp. SA101]CAJ0859558.1 13731_t:CDS:2 [Entrophospora sp. SA101]
MPLSLISPSENDFILKGVDDNIRADGRGRLDYRHVDLETGVIPQASGSARCRLGVGTDVLVGVKIEIGAIEIDGNYEQVVEIKSKRGRVVCSVECSPIASQQFAGRGAEDINNELTQTIERIFNGPQGGLNLEKLCIIPGQQCWVVYIDAMVLDYAGNLSDTIFITTRAALYNARVPKTTIQDHGDGEIEVDISEDVEEWERIYGWDMVPIGVTLNRIGARHIVDATPLEELATETKLLVTVNKMGKICGIQKSGSGCIEPSLLKEMVQTGRTIGLGLIDSLDSMLKQEEEEINKKHARREPIDQLGFFATT